VGSCSAEGDEGLGGKFLLGYWDVDQGSSGWDGFTENPANFWKTCPKRVTLFGLLKAVRAYYHKTACADRDSNPSLGVGNA
jgi:hypothetical protein